MSQFMDRRNTAKFLGVRETQICWWLTEGRFPEPVTLRIPQEGKPPQMCYMWPKLGLEQWLRDGCPICDQSKVILHAEMLARQEQEAMDAAAGAEKDAEFRREQERLNLRPESKLTAAEEMAESYGPDPDDDPAPKAVETMLNREGKRDAAWQKQIDK